MPRNSGSLVISAAVEGSLDEAIIRRLIELVGATPGPVYGKNGKAYLRGKINGFNNAARFARWVVLVDLDGEEECAPPMCANWLPAPAVYLCFRVAVRAVEAWLLADAERIAQFLGVRLSRIPLNCEALEDPKGVLIDLARGSRRREIRAEIVPRPASGRREGRAHTSRLIEFVIDADAGWRPSVAAARCDSLRRSIQCLESLAGQTVAPA